MVEASSVRSGDLVLDLGAGTGVLTAPLLERGARVVAIELHPGRAQQLRRRFDSRVSVVERDLAELYLPRRPFRVVANPPFSLTSPLVRTLLDSRALLSADLVLQAASAGRVARREPRAELGLRIPRRAFDPPPRVDSVVLRLGRASRGRAR